MGRTQVSEYLANEQEKQQYYEPTQAFRRDLYTRDPDDNSTVVRTIREPMSQPMISPLWQRDEFGDPEYNQHMSFKLADFGSGSYLLIILAWPLRLLTRFHSSARDSRSRCFRYDHCILHYVECSSVNVVYSDTGRINFSQAKGSRNCTRSSLE